MSAIANKKRGEPYDVFIGRGSDWGNPYSHLPYCPEGYRCATRQEAIDKYEAYLLEERPDLLARLDELRGKVLGCYCAPLACHGEVLIKFIEEGVPK